MPYLQVEDCSVYYEDIGMGEPVLFLHSHYSRGIIAFCGQIQPFFHSYRCLLPDFRGHGRTVSENKNWDTAVVAQDMAGLLQGLGIKKAHLLGYSMGGGVALHLVASHPELVKSVITIGCGGFPFPEGSEEFTPEALLKNNQTEFIHRIENMHGEASGSWQHYMNQSVRDWELYPNLTEEEWARLTMPMFFIGGEKDDFACFKHLEWMQQRCPQAEIWSVPGAGHRPHMPTEQVQEVNHRMLAFLGKNQ